MQSEVQEPQNCSYSTGVNELAAHKENKDRELGKEKFHQVVEE